MIGSLGKRLRDALKNFASKGRIDEKQLSELIKELQRVLISSDVDILLVSQLSKLIKKRSLEDKPLPGLTLKEHILRVVYDELVNLVGEGIEVPIEKQVKICLLGLYGSGKTTTSAKLGYYLNKKGVKTTLISLDRDRPAAYDQLKQMGEKVGLTTIKELKKKGPIIVDTAGRDSLSDEMFKQAQKIIKQVKPDQTFLVIPAEMGHEAGKQAEALKSLITAVIITRMDGSAKGGGALSACANAGVPVAFIGIGERPEDLVVFEPKRYISRLLGWGDLKGFLEKAEEVKADLGIVDFKNLNMVSFYKQMEALTKMGPFEKVLQMVGLTDLDKKTTGDMKTKLKKYKSIIDSMTKKERVNPDILTSSRIERIAEGSGNTGQDVRSLLKEFNMMKKMVKRMTKGNPAKMMKKMKGMKGFNSANLKSLKNLRL